MLAWIREVAVRANRADQNNWIFGLITGGVSEKEEQKKWHPFGVC